MQESKDLSNAVQLLKQTLPEMSKRSISTTPENYAVWYEFVKGQNTALINEINNLELNKRPLTDEVHRDLYNRHVANARESAVNQLSESVRSIINDFLVQSDTEGAGLNQYIGTLNQFSTNLGQVSEMDQVRTMISELLIHTQEREKATQAMQTSMESMCSEMKKLRAEVARLSGESTTDVLTKLPNKQALEEELDTTMALARSEQSELHLLFLDVDGFSQFNDKFGKTIADKVLKFIGILLKKNLKNDEFLARFQADEFAILIPDVSSETALSTADRIRERLSKQTLSDSAEKMQLGTITVSGGLVSLSLADDESIDSFIRKGQEALDQARKQGGNLVIPA